MASNPSPLTTTTSSSTWGNKLITKLNGLVETSSKETVQTLAKWITFNRKHGNDFAIVLLKQFQMASTARQMVLLNLLHEIFMMESSSTSTSTANTTHANNNNNNMKWIRLAELRMILVEHTLIPVLSQLGVPVQIKIQTNYIKEWEDMNVFGNGPMTLHQIQKVLQKQQQQAAQAQPQQHQTVLDSHTTPAAVDINQQSDAGNDNQDDAGISQQSSEPVVPMINDSTSTTRPLHEQDQQTSLKDDSVDNDPSSSSSSHKKQEGKLLGNQPETVVLDDDTDDKSSKDAKSISLKKTTEAKPTEKVSNSMTTVNGSPSLPTVATTNIKSLPLSLPLVPPPPAALTESTVSTSFGTSTYDFEQSGIAPRTVPVRDLLPPCQLIATIQIARELRNDSAVRISTQLMSLPEDIRFTCATAMEQWDEYNNNKEEEEDLSNDNTMKKPYELTMDQAQDYSQRISDYLLEVDMDEERENLNILTTIIDKQRQARQKLIQMLIESRCQFGAQETAESFDQCDQIMLDLQERKQILSDAMELEGLDVVEEDEQQAPVNNKSNTAGSQIEEEEFVPLTWYNKKDKNSSMNDPLTEKESKKARLL